MTEFHETPMAKKFFGHDIPELVKSVQQLTKTVEALPNNIKKALVVEKEKTELKELNLYDVCYVLKSIVANLPENRDWLDPNMEKAAKEIIRISDV